jgi:2-polyprenyl-6-methoxyphenol hydroxylase-like FAD-dependent oxidoreductase
MNWVVNSIQWGHQLTNFRKIDDGGINFESMARQKIVNTDLIVGADGIRSTVRNILLELIVTFTLLLYCNFACSLKSLAYLESSSDSATVIFKLLMARNVFTLCLLKICNVQLVSYD